MNIRIIIGKQTSDTHVDKFVRTIGKSYFGQLIRKDTVFSSLVALCGLLLAVYIYLC